VDTTTDGVLILRNFTPANPYNMFYDMNGDGVVNTSDFTLYRPQIGTVLPTLQPQLAIGGQGPGGVALLTTNELAPVLMAAIDDWAAAGLPARDVARLRGVSAQITVLPVGYLGAAAIDGNLIYLSADADGYGWSTDTTAGNTTVAVGHEDLLTVVLHELGHTLGLDDLEPGEFSSDLMAETLATGTRRLPSALDVATVIAENLSGPRVPTSTDLMDAVFNVANAEALSLLPAPSLVAMVRFEPDATMKWLSSRQSTSNGPRDQGEHTMRLVVNYQPEAPSGGNRRVNDIVLRPSPTGKARI
jgi:hypothetical protein